jgi:hypothetical protein
MDDRARPRMNEIKEMMTKYGEPRILQRADELDENTGQPHGFYVFELEPDTALYQKKAVDPSSKEWEDEPAQPSVHDSLEDDAFGLLESYEPFCSTCGGSLFEASPAEMAKKVVFGRAEKRMGKAGVPKGMMTGEKPSTKMKKEDIDVACEECSTLATPIDEHTFNGIYCARHGSRLDKYSKACYECKADEEVEECACCPECLSETSMGSDECAICGTKFEATEIADYAVNLADSLFANEYDDAVLEMENNWDDEDDEPVAEEVPYPF